MSDQYTDPIAYKQAIERRFIAACNAYRDHVIADGFNYENSEAVFRRNTMRDTALDIYNFRDEEHNRKSIIDERPNE